MKRARAALVVVVLLLLAGCAEIPTTGSVQVGATEEPNGTSINYIPNPPASGANPREIVAGFVAAASAGGAFTVAKQYLTDAFAPRWNPRSQVLVQEAQPIVSTATTSDVSLRVPITAKVRSNGVYTPTLKPETLDFHLVQQSGQWRIDRAPNGIVLTPGGFQRLYRPLPLQFFDQTWTRLVPDTRWFPVASSGSSAQPSTRSIIDELIAGPVGPIGGGVALNALRGATVQAISAPATDATTVTLTVPESDPSAELATRMQQQLIQSLKAPTASALRLVLNGRVAAPVRALVSQTPAAAAVGVVGGRFGTLSPTGVFAEDTSALGRRVTATKPQAVTVSPKQGLAAVLTTAGDVAVVNSSGAHVIDSRPGVLAPTVDQQGWVYSVPADSPGGLQASDGKSRRLQLPVDLQGSQVNAIEVSPDGTRMLVLVSTNAGPLAYVAGIERNGDGSPSGLTKAHYPVDLGGNTGSGLGATWVDSGDVAVLVAAPDNSVDRVEVQSLGGTSSALGGPIALASTIVGTSDQGDLRILLDSGDLVVSDDQPWHEEWVTAPKISVLGVQR